MAKYRLYRPRAMIRPKSCMQMKKINGKSLKNKMLSHRNRPQLVVNVFFRIAGKTGQLANFEPSPEFRIRMAVSPTFSSDN
jgi:hypothetical protein